MGRRTGAVMTHVQTILLLYGAVCVAATLGYVLADLLAAANRHTETSRSP